MIKAGAHISKGGTFDDALKRAYSLGCTAIQVFPHSPKAYFVSQNFDYPAAKAFGEQAKKLGIVTVFHSAFYVNLAAPRAHIYSASKKSLIKDMMLAQEMQVPYVVTHIGSHTKVSNPEQGRKQILEALDVIVKASQAPDVMLLLETHAGGGTAFGGNIPHLVDMINDAPESTKGRVGVCLDTAHSYAAGYDWNCPEVIKNVKEGLGDLLKVVHFNNPDPKVELGGHLDRHRVKFEEGAVPVGTMKNLFEAFKDKVLIIERSEGSSEEGKGVVEEDLKTIRRWAAEYCEKCGAKIPMDTLSEALRLCEGCQSKNLEKVLPA